MMEYPAVFACPLEDHYTIVRALGSGHSGEVFSCAKNAEGAQDDFAVKALPYNAASEQEIAIWAACRHPNVVDIVGVYDTVLEEGHAVLRLQHAAAMAKLRPGELPRVMPPGRYLLVVMERMHGGELFDYVINHEHPNEETTIAIVEQITEALAHIHNLGFVHGDLKLENCLLFDEPARAIGVKICDFGFARRQDAPYLGGFTANYIAPEAIASRDHFAVAGVRLPVSKEADMWALGVLVFAMCARHVPFEGLPWEPGFRHPSVLTPHNKLVVSRGQYSDVNLRANGTSPAAMTVIRRLLTPNVGARMTAAQLRQHAWLGEGAAFALLPAGLVAMAIL